jgi:hypothetical protein
MSRMTHMCLGEPKMSIKPHLLCARNQAGLQVVLKVALIHLYTRGIGQHEGDLQQGT